MSLQSDEREGFFLEIEADAFEFGIGRRSAVETGEAVVLDGNGEDIRLARRIGVVYGEFFRVEFPEVDVRFLRHGVSVDDS